MTDTSKTQAPAAQLQDEQLDDVSGGPIYVKVDGISATASVSDGTSNIKDGMSHIVAKI